jgi:hypothetical protein
MREKSAEEALIKMIWRGFGALVEEIAEALWGAGVSLRDGGGVARLATGRPDLLRTICVGEVF